ncbi:alpha/beta hydrolase [Rossellomorea aquimaris]|uniref:alpha/beta hydrolase n=1 Tax=Rossellomorea aquimaris TaxID=189382 RepID=UPI001CD560BB|nr:alpha/beta hydrolase [Rossellomorea aquimaris]MCA1054724.1 alpha/beta hydrolase [Rossellomorea aquimaris]
MKKRSLFLGGALSALGIGGLGYYITNAFLYLPKKDEKLVREREVNALRLIQDEFDALPKEEVSIPSPYGYDLNAIFVTPHPHKKYMIFAHGVTENKLNSIKYMNLFIKKGFNAVIYDHRRHGDSGGETTSYGYYEKFDLKAVVDELIRRVGDDVFLGIHGESMGAATTLLYGGGVEDRADFYIADCPYSDFGEQLAYRMSVELNLPAKLLLPLVNRTLKWREGYSLKELSPISVIQNIQKPVLFIHSMEDDYILPKMTEELFHKKQGAKMLHLDFRGTHAQSYNEDPEKYDRVIQQFLDEVVTPEKEDAR